VGLLPSQFATPTAVTAAAPAICSTVDERKFPSPAKMPARFAAAGGR